MNIKTTVVFAMAAAAASVAFAAPTTARAAGTRAKAGKAAVRAAADDDEGGPAARVRIEQFPKLGRAATAMAPSIGESLLGPAWNGKPRKWIVIEAKYSTLDKCIDQLTFTWHVLLETKSATSKDKEGQAKLAPYSYLTQSVTYGNIPKGNHAASVCLHPSYLEQYGEPKAVGLVVTDSNGKVIAGDCESEIKGIPSHPKSLDDAFWNKDSIMDAKQNGEPMIERRQGLQDRSKTIWALVNPNDYELVIQ